MKKNSAPTKIREGPAGLDARAIGARIKRARRSRHWRQIDLAASMKVKPKTVISWENGVKIGLLRTIVRLSRVLNCTVQYLLFGKGRGK